MTEEPAERESCPTCHTGPASIADEDLSDPMGVDFKPYLIRILTAVRRNWFAVIPESARLGRAARSAEPHRAQCRARC